MLMPGRTACCYKKNNSAQFRTQISSYHIDHFVPTKIGHFVSNFVVLYYLKCIFLENSFGDFVRIFTFIKMSRFKVYSLKHITAHRTQILSSPKTFLTHLSQFVYVHRSFHYHFKIRLEMFWIRCFFVRYM